MRLGTDVDWEDCFVYESPIFLYGVSFSFQTITHYKSYISTYSLFYLINKFASAIWAFLAESLAEISLLNFFEIDVPLLKYLVNEVLDLYHT